MVSGPSKTIIESSSVSCTHGNSDRHGRNGSDDSSNAPRLNQRSSADEILNGNRKARFQVTGSHSRNHFGMRAERLFLLRQSDSRLCNLRNKIRIRSRQCGVGGIANRYPQIENRGLRQQVHTLCLSLRSNRAQVPLCHDQVKTNEQRIHPRLLRSVHPAPGLGHVGLYNASKTVWVESARMDAAQELARNIGERF